MGSGKTSAAIGMMKCGEAVSGGRYLYLTPFLAETERIVEACEGLGFQMPDNRRRRYGFRKMEHLKALIAEGRNVAATHQLFSMCDAEVIGLLRSKGYTVVIDEVIEVVKKVSVEPGRLKLVTDAGWLIREETEHGARYTYNAEKAGSVGGSFGELINYAKTRRLLDLTASVSGEGRTDGKFLYWELSPMLFECAEVYVLTYLFEGSLMWGYFKVCGIEWDYVCVTRGQGGYEFRKGYMPVPEHVSYPGDKIHIHGDRKHNELGDDMFALSANWVKRACGSGGAGMKRLSGSTRSFFEYSAKHVPSSQRLWSIYKQGQKYIRRKGYTNRSLAFNCRATNDYSQARALAYLVNVFPDPQVTGYFARNGVAVNESLYALSIMIQWIWRSAIRNGEDIMIYVPSRRMRELLSGWLEDVGSAAEDGRQARQRQVPQGTGVRVN
jgi:hypothetical protein